MRTVRVKAVTYDDGRYHSTPEQLGRHTIVEVVPYDDHSERGWTWEISKVITGSWYLSDCVLCEDEIEDVTDDEVAVALAYHALMGAE